MISAGCCAKPQRPTVGWRHQRAGSPTPAAACHRCFPRGAGDMCSLTGRAMRTATAMRGEIAEQYPGGDSRRDDDIEAGAERPARLILSDLRTSIGQIEDVWRQMPPDAWSRPTAARIGPRPAWMSVWARWRETEIHHVDLNCGYAHDDWPVGFVDLMLPPGHAHPGRPADRGNLRAGGGHRPRSADDSRDHERDRGTGDRPRARVSHLVLAPRTRLRRGRPGGNPLWAGLAAAATASVGVTPAG